VAIDILLRRRIYLTDADFEAKLVADGDFEKNPHRKQITILE
jgi:hypothetical protein